MMWINNYQNDFPEKGEGYAAAINAIINTEDVVIPAGVTAIRNYMFANRTDLTSITIPDSVKSIGDKTFQNCTNLATITINKSANSIPGAPWGAPSTTQVVWNGDNKSGISASSNRISLTPIEIGEPESNIEGTPLDAPDVETDAEII